MEERPHQRASAWGFYDGPGACVYQFLCQAAVDGEGLGSSQGAASSLPPRSQQAGDMLSKVLVGEMGEEREVLR